MALALKPEFLSATDKAKLSVLRGSISQNLVAKFQDPPSHSFAYGGPQRLKVSSPSFVIFSMENPRFDTLIP